MGTYIALGLVIGAGMGLTVLDNLALGLGAGVVIGIIADLAVSRRGKS